MAFIDDVYQTQSLVQDPFTGPADPGSLYEAFYSRAASQLMPSPGAASIAHTPADRYVNYADPPATIVGPLMSPPRDLLQLDADPFGSSTEAWVRQNGISAPAPGDTVYSLDVFGRRMSRDQLQQTDAGRRLLELAERRRRGVKRDFWDAIVDWSWEDVPFVSLFATVGKSVADAVTVSDTFKKLQNGEPVTDDELIKTRLYMAETEERESGTWGATVGDIMRAAPGFVAEFFVTGGAYSLARTGLAKAGKGGIHLGMSRVTKLLAREAMQDAAERAVAKGAVQGAAGFAKLGADAAARKGLVKEVAGTILTNTMKGNPLYKGLTDDALRAMAESRAELEFSRMLSRNAGGKIANGFGKFAQWLGQNVSRGLMDFGAWGTEEATVLTTGRSKALQALADAVGTFVVDAPIKGAMMWAPNQLLARPLVGAVLGQDGRTVSGSQLSLEASAYRTGNKELMANAEAMSHGLSLLEYVSENTGRGLSSMLRAAGLGLEKAGIRGLVRPTARALGLAEDKMDAVTLGGKMRQWVASVFGSREDYIRKTTKDKVSAVARKLGVTGGTDLHAIETAVLSNSTSALRPELAAAVGQDVGKFAMSALKELTDKERRDFEYKTFGKFMVADWMARHQVGPETMMNMFDRLGYDGVLGEMFEERYSDFAKGLFGWDDRTDHDIWSNLRIAVKNLYPGWDQLTAEAVAFATPMVMRAGILRAQSAVLGGDGVIRDTRAKLAAIDDAARVSTVTPMTRGEYLATHQRLVEQDARKIAELEEEKAREEKALDDAVKMRVQAELDDPRTAKRLEAAEAAATRRAARAMYERRVPAGEAREYEQRARSRARENVRARIVREVEDKERERLLAPGAAHERVRQLDEDIARARKVAERRRERHEKFLESVPDAAEAAVDEIVVPLYTDDELADDTLYDRSPAITEDQARGVLAARNAMVDFAPELSRRLVEATSRMDGEDATWWRRAAHRLVGVADALVTGDFSIAAENPVQWTARDMGLSRRLVDGLSKNMRDYVSKARTVLEENQGTALEAVARLRGVAQRRRDAGDVDGAAAIDRQAEAVLAQYGEDGRIGAPSRKDVLDLAERLASPSAKRIMAANLATHQLRSFTRREVKDQALGLVARELGYEWYVDKDGGLRFYKYNKDTGDVDQASAMDADSFYSANQERADELTSRITEAAVDVLTRRLTKAGDDSVRLMNAVTLPDTVELREMAQRRLPGEMGPPSQDAVMLEAALYDAAMRAIGAEDIVERVRMDEDTPLAEVLDRGALARVNMATVKYLARYDKVEDVPDSRAFEALAWSLALPFDGTEKGLADRNKELFSLAKLAEHFSRDDKAYYAKHTAIDDVDASRLTPNGNIPLVASLVNGVWVADLGRNEDGTPKTAVYSTRDEMDAKLLKMGYRPDQSRLVLTLARVIESRDMFGMLRELGLAPEYLASLSADNLHPMLRKNAAGDYLSEADAHALLRAELAAADGGEKAPKNSKEFAAWARVWGEHGYMRAGEKLLRAYGVEKSVVSNYAGEFSDYAPPVYTLSLSAGRLSPTSANVYVPVDPLNSPDLVSGVVNGLLIQAFMTHPRLLRDSSMKSTISDFAREVNAVIDMHVEKAKHDKDKDLVTALERLRRMTVSDTDRSVRQADGTFVDQRGAGMTASGFAMLANAFVLGRESDYSGNPHLRACADIASDVRMCPAFAEFYNVVDLVLGGNGPLSAASRIAAGNESAAEGSMRGLERVMTYAAGSDAALAKTLKEMRPLGLTPRQFLDVCVRRLTAQAKSGAAVIPAKRLEELRSLADAASTDTPTPKAHLTFYGQLIAVVKRAIETDLPVPVEFRDFVAELAETAQDDPGVTGNQKKALRQMLGILTRTRVVGRVRQFYADAFNSAKTAEQRYEEARKARVARGRELRAAKKKGLDQSSPNTYEAMRREVTETRTVERKVREEYSAAVRAFNKAKQDVQASEKGGRTPDILGWDTVWTRTSTDEEIDQDPLESDANVGDLEGGSSEAPSFQDSSNDAEDDASVAETGAVELPKITALAEDRTVMSHGFDELSLEMDRSAQRLCVNVCVRAIAMRALSRAADLGADSVATAVTEEAVVKMAKTLFHFSDKEANALRFQYRVADELRTRSHLTWTDVAQSGTRWNFQEDDKEDDDVSSDKFSNRAADEYNSPFLADVLSLAARVAPESGKNLRAFIDRTKEWMRKSGESLVVPGVTATVAGVPVAWEQSSEGHTSSAWYDPKTGTIHVHAEGVREKYASGVWKNPARSSAIPNADTLIKSADDLVAWAVYHELGHARDTQPRDASETGALAREDRANAFASRHLARAKRQAAMAFVSSLLDPRLDVRGSTQAEHSALHMKALAMFDESPDVIASYVDTMLSTDESGKFPVSRRLGFLLSYMAALPMEDRRNFALLCANSVSAQAMHVKSDPKTGSFVEERRVGAGDKVSDRIVGDTFVHVLEGKPAAEAAKLAADLREAQTDVLKDYPRGGAKVAAAVLARVFGRESPLVTALASDSAAQHRIRKGSKTVNAELAKSVTPVDGHVPVVESIAATLDALAARGEPLTADNVTTTFIALFETGRSDVDVGVRRLSSGPSFTDPLKTWLSTYTDSLPATILSAEVDQRRDSSGSSVPIAPRDSVPMISRWIYSNEKARGVIDGRVVEFPTFKEFAKQAFPNATDEQIERCRQDACWPDGTPVCAKNTSTSLTTRELYLACENAYKRHLGDAWYIPLYAGDHSSSTMLRIPWAVKMDGFMKVVQILAATPEPVGAWKIDMTGLAGSRLTFARKDEAKFNYLGGVTRMIAFGRPGSATDRYGTKDFASIAVDGTGATKYTADDVVGVSLNGGDLSKPGSVKLSDPRYQREIENAIAAGATFIADNPYHRNRSHNREQEGKFAELLKSRGYVEEAREHGSIWRPGSTVSSRPLVTPSLQGLLAKDGPQVYSAMSVCVDALGTLAFWKEKGQKGATGKATVPEIRKLMSSLGSVGIGYSDTDFQGFMDAARRMGLVDSDGTVLKSSAELVQLSAKMREASEKDRSLARLLKIDAAVPVEVRPLPQEQAVSSAPLGYRDAAKAMSYAVGMNLMYTDTKRSAITSLENQGAGLIGAEVQTDGTVKYGEHRVHIIHNWAFEREGYSFKNKNEALLGTTRMYGYGARTMKTLAKDRKSDLLKLHLISTSGHDLFFIKSLSVAISEDKNDSFLDDTMNRVIEDYARSFRGDDRISTDTYTDDDSYKIGVGNSKAILVQTADGKRQKLMAWLFKRLRDALPGVPKDASEKEVAAAFLSNYGKLTGDKLDDLVADVEGFPVDKETGKRLIPIVDLARTDGSEPTPMKLSELMPGVMVNAVEGLDGPCLDLSYREDGAMAYTVANVAHSSRVSNEPGRVARNYEMDLITAAVMLGDGSSPYIDRSTVQDAYDLVSNWGLAAACVYATRPQREAMRAQSLAIEELRTDGEHPDGQNIRSELARAVWAQIRKNSNLPVKGVDAALVANGASVDDNNMLMAHSTSRMHLAMLRGAEIFTADEQAFFGKKFRHALCNVNMTTPGFRHSWFLDRAQFDALAPRNKFMTDREVATELARLFTVARNRAQAAQTARGDAKRTAEAAALETKKDIARLFVDHHGLPIWSDDPAKSGHTEKYVLQFQLADLFDKDGSFDMTALQIDGDRVHNDATGQEHILLGGTKFGLPRTPSYNAHYETVRAGLPVKEQEYVVGGQTRWRVSHDAMVSPDPYTNKILGTDHDGDKSKLYLLHTDKYGLADERMPPPPPPEVFQALSDNSPVILPNHPRMNARDAYVRSLFEDSWLERVWVNPETGKEEPVPAGEAPEGMYHRISDRAKLAVSNAFVRTMFTISDSVPTLDMDGTERVSESSTQRTKCLGGIAFRPVSTQPVLSNDAWERIVASAAAPVLGEGETVGDPERAADVSTSAEDADGARATIVSLARTLHVAFASGQFSDLFGGQPTGLQWLAFLNHFDGLSNATFDDIKEQICGRLGWTKGMMDTVIVELLSSMDHLPTTDGEWADILSRYSANIVAGRAEYWMLKAAKVDEDDFVRTCLGELGVEKASKEDLHAAMGVQFNNETREWEPNFALADAKTPLQRVIAEIYRRGGGINARGLSYIAESVSSRMGHNSTLGRLAYLVSVAKTNERDLSFAYPDIDAAVRWANKRSQLAEAQAFERAVNYLTADPGDASKFAKYGSSDEVASVIKDPTTGSLLGDITQDAFRKMEVATGMMYRVAGDLATIEATAALAAVQRDQNIAKLAAVSPEAAAFLFVKDAVPRWNKKALTANQQQLPFLLSLFARQTTIAANVTGTPLTDGMKLYGAVRAMAGGVAKWRHMAGQGLAARAAIESTFAIMYRLMTTSTEFAGGAVLPGSIRAPHDKAYENKTRDGVPEYGEIGPGLLRIMPGYRANDRESHERVRVMYDDIVRGRAYAGTRTGNWGERKASQTDCRTFSISRGSLRKYITEQLPVEYRKSYRRGELDHKVAMSLLPEDVRNEVRNAIFAVTALCEFLGDEDAAITPAMMFGQLLPLYSLMTSRCLGAPDPSSPSLLALAPSWLYEELSAGEADLAQRCPWLVGATVAANWAPYLENVHKTRKRYKNKKLVDVKVKNVNVLADKYKGLLATEDDNGDVTLPDPSQTSDLASAEEFRENPDWRTTVDIFSDGAFEAALKAAGPSTSQAVPAATPAPGPAPMGAGAYDEKVARVAGALGLALGTWATVEYVGGSTFMVRGKLRGTMGQGKNVVFTVDMSDEMLCTTDRQVEALADSEAYGASLAGCVDLDIKTGQDFLRLPRDVRLALVRRYGLGGSTSHHVNVKFDGKGVATLVGAIRLGRSKADTTVFHEYFHAMMRVFDEIGLFSEEDKAALRKTFGEPAKRGQWFNEEKAANAFRNWVEGKMDAKAEERHGIFRRIYEALKGILLAIRRGFGYTDDSEANMELLFSFVAHGFAQASDSKVEEVAAGAQADDAAALEAACIARNDLAVATTLARIIPPPRIENVDSPVGRIARAGFDAARTAEKGLRPFDMGVDSGTLSYELEALDEYDMVPQELRSRSLALKGELVAAINDPSTPADMLKGLMAEMVELRTRIAEAMGQVNQEGPIVLEPTGIGDEDSDFAPGSAEATIADTRTAVKTVTVPLSEVNDFYRAANFIHEALERGLASEGSWRAPLADVVRRYSPARGNGVDENRDAAVVLNGLRHALDAVNPGASRQLDDEKLRRSLVFEAALRLYHGLDAWIASKSSGSPLPAEPGSDEASEAASHYDVSAWILSSRPLSAADTVLRAMRTTEEMLNREDVTEPVRAELQRHRDALQKVLEKLGDETGLLDFRRGDLKPVFDEAFTMLREGTHMNGHDADGRLRDITPNIDALFDYRDAGMSRALHRMEAFEKTYEVPMVQESLKSALSALWQTAAQVKFYRETDTTPATAEDLEQSQQMARRHNAPHMTPAEWAATQAIGDSNLVDNRPLVDFYCQPAFIANNVDAWLQSLVRKSFGARGNIGEMLSAENREFGALKMRIADLENFYSLLLGTNVEDGGALLQVETVTGKWKMRWGEVVRDAGDTYLKIDNYRRKPTKIKLTEADLRVIDLYLKSISAFVSGQKRMLTGIDRLWFSPDDLKKLDPSNYTREAIAALWNEGHPTGHMTAFEMALARLDLVMPEDVHGSGKPGFIGLRDRLVSTVISTMTRERDAATLRGEKIDFKKFNRTVLRALQDKNIAMMRADGSFGTIAVPVDAVNQMFLNSEAYRKLQAAGRDPAWISREKIAEDFLSVYRDAVRFARKHPWLTHGDGQHFNNFGTTLPFWRGDGVFMYNMARIERDEQQSASTEMTGAEKALFTAAKAEDIDVPLNKLEFSAYSELLSRVGEAYGTPAQGYQLASAITEGKYEEGSDLADRTGLELPKDATKADLARALYKSALKHVHDVATGAKTGDFMAAEKVIRLYEESRLERGELFGGTFGMNDEDMYRLHGKLPANAQIGHKVHLAIDGLTNAMMSRATLANLLMTPAEDGAPVYYADPSEFAADVSGLPDAFWANIARWWAEWNGFDYDAKLTGVQNAKALYKKISESREGNKGKIGKDEYARSYTELSRDDARDCITVDHWLVRDDDRSFDESSAMNSLGGGEAMGYLKQFVQAGRTLGFGGNKARATLHRALSWSKSMSVSFSMFFPLATKWESPIGAVGATATIMSNMRHLGSWLREHPELARMMQRAVGGRGWITQNFIGFNDIIEMMDTNDPFLAEMKAWANALGVTLSTSLVNPMEPTKSIMTEDLRWLKERIRDNMGAKAAAKFGRIVETVVTRGGDKAFNYALNATKLAVVAQMCMKLRHQAAARGKAFDPVRDLRRYRRYINAEIGGIDPLQYAWATPFNRGLMNTLLFSWQWTRGAWEAGGGSIIEDMLLGGHTMTKEEREYMVGRWCRMFGAVMIGVPALMQCVVMGLAKALGGGDDDDDHWATWQNESKARWSAFDLTPLLRAIERSDDAVGANRAGALLGGLAGALAGGRLGGNLWYAAAGAGAGALGGALLPEGSLHQFKQGGGSLTTAAGAGLGAVLGYVNGGNKLTATIGGLLGAAGGSLVPSLIPLYTGDDVANKTTRARRYYMHFGKQGWEFLRWFEDAKGQFFSKLSMPTQRILEGVMGRNPSYMGGALPWDEMGQFERWLAPTLDGATYNFVRAFLPFSFGGMSRLGDAGFLPTVGPVLMGASQTNIQDRLVKAITAWAWNDRGGYSWGAPSRGTKSAKLLSRHVVDILRDAKANGLDPEKQLNTAYGQVQSRVLGKLMDLVPDDPSAGYDVKAVERTARAINRLGAKRAQVLRSLKQRAEQFLKARDVSWRDLPEETRTMYRQIADTVEAPFGSFDY